MKQTKLSELSEEAIAFVDGVYESDLRQRSSSKVTMHINSETGNDLLGDGSKEKPFKSFKGYSAYVAKNNIVGEVALNLSGSFTETNLPPARKQARNRAERRTLKYGSRKRR